MRLMIFKTTWLYHALIILAFLLIAFLNRIPQGSMVAGGDFYQILNPDHRLYQFFFAWINHHGQGTFNTLFVAFPAYIVLAALQKLGASVATIASLQIFFFLSLAYLSFYWAIKLIYPQLPPSLRIGGALVYALNHFTFSIFLYPWGFTHHYLFYIFLPPLITSFIYIFTANRFSHRRLILFASVFLLSLVSYNNLAFFAVLLLVQGLIFVFMVALKHIKLDANLLKKIVGLGVVYGLLFGWFVLSFYLANSAAADKLTHTQAFGGDIINNIIKQTSGPILNTLQLDYNTLFNTQPNPVALVYPIILGLLLFFDRSKNAIRLVLFSVFIVLIFLAARLAPPFTAINSFIYHTTFFSLFRSPDKIFVCLPVIYVLLLVTMLQGLKLKRSIVALLFVLLLIIPYGFYLGIIPRFLGQPNAQGYSNIVKVPDEYYRIQGEINSHAGATTIVSLPSAIENSINWSNYPKWHFVGHDMLYLLYDKLYVSANAYDHPILETKLSFRDINQGGSAEQLLQNLQKFSAEYVLYHKDISRDRAADNTSTLELLTQLQDQQLLSVKEDNDYFTLYKLSEPQIKPLIFADSSLTFNKVNPAKYEVHLHLPAATTLTLHQAYNEQWALYLGTGGWLNCLNARRYESTKSNECLSLGKQIDFTDLGTMYKKPLFNETHRLTEDYANTWTIDPEYIKRNFPPEDYIQNTDGSIDVNLIIYFKLQSYFYLGLLISAPTFIGCMGYLLYWARKRTVVLKVKRGYVEQA